MTVVRDGIGDELACAAARPAASELEASAAASAREHEVRPAEDLGATLVRLEPCDYGPVGCRTVAVGAASGDGVEPRVEAFEGKPVRDDDVVGAGSTLRHGRGDWDRRCRRRSGGRRFAHGSSGVRGWLSRRCARAVTAGRIDRVYNESYHSLSNWSIPDVPPTAPCVSGNCARGRHADVARATCHPIRDGSVVRPARAFGHHPRPPLRRSTAARCRASPCRSADL